MMHRAREWIGVLSFTSHYHNILHEASSFSSGYCRLWRSYWRSHLPFNRTEALAKHWIWLDTPSYGISLARNNDFPLFLMRTRLPPRKTGPLIELSAFQEVPYLLFAIGNSLCFLGLYFTIYYVSATSSSAGKLQLTTSTDFSIRRICLLRDGVPIHYHSHHSQRSWYSRPPPPELHSRSLSWPSQYHDSSHLRHFRADFHLDRRRLTLLQTRRLRGFRCILRGFRIGRSQCLSFGVC